MKHFLSVALLTLCFSPTIFAQRSFDNRFASIQKELTDWDPVRGHWLATSLVNLSENKPVEDRAFPEDFTPFEIAKLMPTDLRSRIVDTIQSNANSNPSEANRWNAMNAIVGRVGCSYISGRTYGDPHLTSFDRANYSFQTVGEFVLVKSTKNNFEIQCRQQPQGDNFSLNTAVAMNVAGDRVAIYTEDKPDFDPSPLRLNGSTIQLSGRTFYLPHGGNIRLTGRNYVVTYPTGEVVNVEMRQSGNMSFLNVTVQIFDCDRNSFTGLLGNANNNPDDDFNSNINRSNHLVYSNVFGNSSVNQYAEKEYLAFLAGNFAEDWRVNQNTTLFDYSIGQSTLSFTDRSFPRVHYTVDDLTPNQLSNARRNCEDRGILASDMRGCIYDQGFLNITPNPVPTNPDFTQGVSFKPILRPALNTNQHEFADGKTPTGNALPIQQGPNTNSTGKGIGEKEMPKEIINEPIVKPERSNRIIEPVREKPQSNPSYTEPSRSNNTPTYSAPKNPPAPRVNTPRPVSTPSIKGIKGKN